MNEAYPFERRRLDERVHMRVPVEVKTTIADGGAMEEKTYTGMVGALGAMVRMSRTLEIGSELELTNRFSQQTEKFRVVWVKAVENSELWEIGVEAFHPLGDFWGVRFPPRPEAG